MTMNEGNPLNEARWLFLSRWRIQQEGEPRTPPEITARDSFEDGWDAAAHYLMGEALRVVRDVPMAAKNALNPNARWDPMAFNDDLRAWIHMMGRLHTPELERAFRREWFRLQEVWKPHAGGWAAARKALREGAVVLADQVNTATVETTGYAQVVDKQAAPNKAWPDWSPPGDAAVDRAWSHAARMEAGGTVETRDPLAREYLAAQGLTEGHPFGLKEGFQPQIDSPGLTTEKMLETGDPLRRASYAEAEACMASGAEPEPITEGHHAGSMSVKRAHLEFSPETLAEYDRVFNPIQIALDDEIENTLREASGALLPFAARASHQGEGGGAGGHFYRHPPFTAAQYRAAELAFDAVKAILDARS